MNIYKADILHAPVWGEIEVHEDSYLIEEGGKVVAIQKELDDKYKGEKIHDYSGKLMVPSFSDIHFHAVQYANMGLGMDLPLLPWLNTYTFPEENKYQDMDYADRMFTHLVHDLYSYGTLRSCIYSSLHVDATLLLMEKLDGAGLSAYVGKVNMDRNSTDEYVEETEQSVKDTIKWLEAFESRSGRIQPIISPRFIPSCTDELIVTVSKMAHERDLAVQTHLNENPDEIEWVKELCPESQSYLHAYDDRHTLREYRTIMGHVIHNTPEELELLKEKQIYVAHCPSSNMNLMSGVAQAKKMVEYGIPVGLASDISGGDSLIMNEVMVDAIKASKLLGVLGGDHSNIMSTEEVFYLATTGSGSFFGKAGCFKEGYSFDALIIDEGSYNVRDNPSMTERLELYVYKADERNIIERILEGEILQEPVIK